MEDGGARQFEPGRMVPGTRYRVVQLIGHGGMGRVYEVEQIELGKRFVLKALHDKYAARSDLVARMRQEWQALGQLRHPGIVGVIDAGVNAGGIPFYVMERLEGETLRARLRRESRLTKDLAVHVAIEVLEALAAAHEIGVVHRDVKPANVFLLRSGGVKLLDFGIAKSLARGDTITARGVTVGTPRYMSPEQARGEAVDGRADLYAVGLVLFEMLSGRGPFDGVADVNGVFLAHLTRPAPPLDDAVAGVDPALVELVARLLAKSPGKRPSSARTVAAALRKIRRTWTGRPAHDTTPTALAAPAVLRSLTEGMLVTEVIGERPISAAPARSPVLVTERIVTTPPGAEAAGSTSPPRARPGEFVPRIPETASSRLEEAPTMVLSGAIEPAPDVTRTVVRTGAARLEAVGPVPEARTAAAKTGPMLLVVAALAVAGMVAGMGAVGLGWWLGRLDVRSRRGGPELPGQAGAAAGATFSSASAELRALPPGYGP